MPTMAQWISTGSWKKNLQINLSFLRGRGGMAEQLLRRIGSYLQTLENLLEQPRYLMMAVMATFVVIL